MENPGLYPEPQQDLLTDLMVDLQSASTGKRFANYLIDLACFYIFIIIFFAILIAQGIISTGMNSILDRLITLLCYGIFMGLVEAIFKGKTLGKVCTRTRAVNEDGSPISAKTAFLRGLSRAVPFEAFSAFGYPWHDRWTNTIVIDEARSVLSK